MNDDELEEYKGWPEEKDDELSIKDLNQVSPAANKYYKTI